MDGKEVKEEEVQEEGHDHERLDYGLGPTEESLPALHTRSCSRIRSQAQVVKYVDSGSNKVFFFLMLDLSPVFFCY